MQRQGSTKTLGFIVTEVGSGFPRACCGLVTDQNSKTTTGKRRKLDEEVFFGEVRLASSRRPRLSYSYSYRHSW